MSFNILDVMRDNGYKPHPDGVCYGLACMAAQEVAKGKGAFYKGLVTYIINHGSIDDNDDNCAPLRNTFKAFFDSVIIYSGESLTIGHMKALGLPIQRGMSAPARLFSLETQKINTADKDEGKDNISDCKITPCVVCKFLAVFDKESMSSYLKMLHSYYKNTPFALVVMYPEHAVQIGFDGSNWLSVSHDNTVYEGSEGFDDVLDNILTRRDLCGDHWCAGVEIVLGKPDESLSVVPRSIEVSLQEFISLQDAQRQQFMLLALQHGYHDSVRDFACILNRWMRGKRLQKDVCWGKRLSIGEFIKLAAAKSEQGIPGLFMALEEGHTEAVKVFMELLAELLQEGRLSKEAFIKLAAAKDDREVPGLFKALQFGHSETVRAFMKVLAELLQRGKLSEEVFIELAAAKDDRGVPGLFKALQFGHSETVKVFMTILTGLLQDGSLSKEDTEVEKFSRSIRVQSGHHEAFREFTAALSNLIRADRNRIQQAGDISQMIL